MTEVNKVASRDDQAGIFWILGYVLVGLSAWLFFDSTKMTTLTFGYVSGLLPRGGFWDTSSMAIIFTPLLGGLLWFIYNIIAGANTKWAKTLSWTGLAIVAIEALSRVRFHMAMKTSFFLLLVLMLATGLAMLLRARILNRHEKFHEEKKEDA